MAASEKDDRTEGPSARRLETARGEGQVALSRELQSVTVIGCALLAMSMTGPARTTHFILGMQRLMSSVGQVDMSAGGTAVIREMLLLGVGLAAPVVLAAVGGVVGITLLQTGFLLRPAGLMPQLGRLSPAKGLMRIVGGDNLMETLKALVKLIAFALVLRHVLEGLWPVLLGSTAWDAGTLANRAAGVVMHALLMLLGVQAVIAGLDVGWVRYRHMSKLRMSKQELRDEQRESDGDPHVKARQRQIRRQRSKRRMMDAVSRATVVIVNPTHFAVALAYDQGGKGAPRIIAKGVDQIAARIRAIAEDNKVPLVANPPLARALYTVPLDQEIPQEHFQVVAGIIAYVWRLQRPPPGSRPIR
ncbi:EscU/YscU/HrcU family type III secretion system export apparatus switch protein [Lichenicola cladoniae]|uniref:EscU/YscU/HrcU family type III secretion system export apparatus switch protein n=1 Tax=Lichenicola cladoniae TaxID=1484109 RepID=A0A6M8HT87_9PROT|nr:EscU/YscU/HrcU family type III secretion system export apparatus switch protein [Lichenicola cladoniae]NPD65444.1 EscU/YscU/HrcU family type III secretion system export apparatus switch protein [Acetobacteraceae bacterium]QKE91486.1 EscU/YscU/HrcU family type III secretion system export apparatus switch protein [Lichenicola cladoniae]